MKLVLLLLLILQQEETISRASKAPYVRATEKCEKAVAQMETDPREAIDVFTSILENPKIKKRECLMRMEITPGTYSRQFKFFPWQYRGRARMRLAEKTGDREIALGLLRLAREDLNESIRAGLASSQTYLAQAQQAIEKRQKVEPPKIDPEPLFRKTWRGFIAEGRFDSAKGYIESKGGFLSPDRRRYYLSETDDECRRFLATARKPFLVGLERVTHPEILKTMDQVAFEQDFRLPGRAELVVTIPEYEWCVSVARTLVLLRGGKDGLGALLDHALSAGTMREFLGVERLAYAIVREEIEDRVQEAREAAAKRREELQGEADALRNQWEQFEARVAKKGVFREFPRRNFALLLKEFPIDFEEGDRILDRLMDCMDADDPDRAMSEVEESLRGIRNGWSGYSRESRAEIVRCQIAVAALRGLLKGNPVDEMARILRPFGVDLENLGGSFELQQFGPKVARLFQRLRQDAQAD